VRYNQREGASGLGGDEPGGAGEDDAAVDKTGGESGPQGVEGLDPTLVIDVQWVTAAPSPSPPPMTTGAFTDCTSTETYPASRKTVRTSSSSARA